MSTITTLKIQALHVGKVITFHCADLSLANQISPTWSSEQAYGKMDPIAAYSHTGRKMSFDAVLLASTLTQAQSNQTKVDRLIKSQYPKYRSAAGGKVLSAPPFFKVTALKGHMYSSVKGFFDSFDIQPGSSEDVVPFVSNHGNFYERKWSIKFAMTVLHSDLPGWVDGVEPGGSGKSFIFTANRSTAAAGATVRTETGANSLAGNTPNEPLTEEQKADAAELDATVNRLNAEAAERNGGRRTDIPTTAAALTGNDGMPGEPNAPARGSSGTNQTTDWTKINNDDD